ncbi:MAG: hypothetical protein M3042_12965 [Actinomycetota bacterium]|nr:hypothetical protein [Actinomycetota bacterium]
MTDDLGRMFDTLSRTPVPTPSRQAVKARGRARGRHAAIGTALAVTMVLAGATAGGIAVAHHRDNPTRPVPPAGRSVAPSPEPSTSATPPARQTPAPVGEPVPSAMADLAPFFAATDQADSLVRIAARLVSADVSATSGDVTYRPATDQAIAAAATGVQAVAAAIPAGMKADLLKSVLAVYNDLEVRSLAFRPAQSHARLLQCLRNGSAAARRFPADVAAARAMAAGSPPVSAVAPASRPAAEIALRLAEIRTYDGGCQSCGDTPFKGITPIVWGHVPPAAGTGDGTISGISFTARYQAGQGWVVMVNAC